MQFGKPLIEFELIQEKIVKAFVDNEVIWTMTNFTAGMLEQNPLAHVAIESSHCKLYGTNRAWDTLYNAMQIAGGSGYLKTQPYEKRMRDFRVATIFEGTSEIHSIYPPLSAFRNMAKNLSHKKSALARTVFLAALYFKGSRISVQSRDTLVSISLRAINSYAISYRKLFIKSLKKFGKNIADQELLLRRLTTISVHIFALISMIRKIDYIQQEKTNAEGTRNALQVLLSESEEIVQNNSRLDPGKIEIEQKKVVQYLKESLKD
jgi:acyl-CoA dehydrogenase family member 9